MAILTWPQQHRERLVWRFQGIKNQCWLTSIEMLMYWKHGNIYGVNRDGTRRKEHADHAREEAKKNEGSYIWPHRNDYQFKGNYRLQDCMNVAVWQEEIRMHGPVLAEGNYAWARIGWGAHAILIVGVSTSGQLAYYNPNVMAVMPHPQSKLSYMSVSRCVKLARPDGDRSPFWQCRD